MFQAFPATTVPPAGPLCKLFPEHTPGHIPENSKCPLPPVSPTLRHVVPSASLLGEDREGGRYGAKMSLEGLWRCLRMVSEFLHQGPPSQSVPHDIVNSSYMLVMSHSVDRGCGFQLSCVAGLAKSWHCSTCRRLLGHVVSSPSSEVTKQSLDHKSALAEFLARR